MMSEDLFEDLFEECAVEESMKDHEASQGSTPVDSSGISGEFTAASGCVAASSSTAKSKIFACDLCNKVLKTASGFEKHKILHMIKDVNSRRPSFHDLVPVVVGFADEILKEMSEDPDNSTETVSFISKILARTEEPDWFHILSAIADPILEIVSENSKVLPSNQFEEQQMRVNHLLNNDAFFEDIKSKLFSFTGCDVSSVSRFIFRLLTDLYTKLQSYVFEIMRGERQDTSKIELRPSSEEIEAFLDHTSEILRAYFLKCSEIKSVISAKHRVCLLNKFVIKNDMDETVTEDEFLSKSSWEGMENDPPTLTLSPRCKNFFLSVNQLMKSALKTRSQTSFKCIADAALNSLLTEDESTLDMWYHLTAGFMPESEAILFLKQILNLLACLLLRLELKKLKRIETTKKRIQVHGLRSHLKRN